MVGFDLRRKRVISYFVKSSGEREREREEYQGRQTCRATRGFLVKWKPDKIWKPPPRGYRNQGQIIYGHQI